MWDEAQDWESGWWGNCANTYGEEEKQLVYARRMGLRFFHNQKSPYNIDMKGRSVVDIGGGPSSLLLKCVRLDDAMVIDPCPFPEWVEDRYTSAGIRYVIKKGEELGSHFWDEAWIYNCLQHTEDPSLVAANALATARIVRVFEWVNTRVNVGHPHAFTAEVLDNMFHGQGKRETLRGEGNCHGDCWYGVFIGRDGTG